MGEESVQPPLCVSLDQPAFSGGALTADRPARPARPVEPSGCTGPAGHLNATRSTRSIRSIGQVRLPRRGFGGLIGLVGIGLPAGTRTAGAAARVWTVTGHALPGLGDFESAVMAFMEER